jgi:hypothetical protein
MFVLNEKVYEWLLPVHPNTKYGNFVFSRDALKAIRPAAWGIPALCIACIEDTD